MPDVCWSSTELAAAREAVMAGRPPWMPAYAQLIAAAEQRKNQRSHAAPSYDLPGNYIAGSSSIVDPTAYPKLAVLIGDGDAAFTCALAWYMTRNTTYAATAAALCRSWATVNKGLTNHDGPLGTCTQVAGLILAAAWLEGYPGWTAGDAATFAAYVRNVIVPTATLCATSGHNWRSWAMKAKADAASYLGDAALLASVAQELSAHIVFSINPITGRLPEEESRGARATYYTYYSLFPMLAACRSLRTAEGPDYFAKYTVLINKALLAHFSDFDATGHLTRKGQDSTTSYDLAEAMGAEYQHNGGYLKTVANAGRPVLSIGHALTGFTPATLMCVTP